MVRGIGARPGRVVTSVLTPVLASISVSVTYAPPEGNARDTVTFFPVGVVEMATAGGVSAGPEGPLWVRLIPGSATGTKTHTSRVCPAATAFVSSVVTMPGYE